MWMILRTTFTVSIEIRDPLVSQGTFVCTPLSLLLVVRGCFSELLVGLGELIKALLEAFSGLLSLLLFVAEEDPLDVDVARGFAGGNDVVDESRERGHGLERFNRANSTNLTYQSLLPFSG
ncbi:hypothetical protein NM208_g16923 [Fusarium decemcellulare]|uniref:Uncharacterized protein n=1 Tax=Fusarium decemcellulare TaxID=57161 RepID=A0ACC1RBD4_9HYPO|nr:hypothetical protein NM208_g16923 [Fusarium decemcellulare]